MPLYKMLCPKIAAAVFVTGAALLAATPSGAQAGAPVLTLPIASSGGQSSTYLSISLADGSSRLIDRLSRDPLHLRSRTLDENLFRLIGRATDQQAAVGEIFFAPILSGDGGVRAGLYVETPIGYVAYFEDPGRGNRLGEIKALTSRAFEGVAAADGNFALLMRQDNAGRTDGAYLYHATAGTAVYLDGLRKLELSPRTRTIEGLPRLAGRVSADAVYLGSEEPSSYAVVDSASGEIHFLELTPRAPQQIRPVRLDFSLWDVFERQGTHTSGRRFVLVAVDQSLAVTEHLFIADAVTGETAVLEFVTNADVETRLRKGRPVGGLLSSGGDGGERVFSAVPRVSDTGATLGVWLIDSQSRRTVYVDRPGLPDEMTVTSVVIDRR